MTVSQHKSPDELAGWFTRKIDAGHVMQAMVIAVAAVGIWFSNQNNVANAQRDILILKDSAQRDIAGLKGDMATQFERMQNSQDKMKDELSRAINSNPVIDRHFNDIERWISATEAYRTAHETRISEIERQDARMRADLDAILRASNAPIRNAR